MAVELGMNGWTEIDKELLEEKRNLLSRSNSQKADV